MLKRLLSFFMDIIQVIVFASAIFAFIYLLILQPHKIKGLSMSPNFPDGEYLLTDKVSYRFHEPERGDVVVFETPTSTEGEEFIKRIIGLPGERIMVKDGKIFINGRQLNEEYIERNIYTSAGPFLAEGKTVTVPQEQFFVAGDNRPHSSDSRAWGFIGIKAITGRAWLIYWTISFAGTIKAPTYNF